MALRILYTSTTNSGNFNCEIGPRGTAIGGDLSRSPGGAKILPAPNTAHDLVEQTVNFSGLSNIIDADSQIMSMLFRRFGDSPEDSSVGNLRVVGIVLENLEK